jgi:hypothetical protein
MGSSSESAKASVDRTFVMVDDKSITLVDPDRWQSNGIGNRTAWFVVAFHETQCSVPKTLSIQSMEAVESIPQPSQVFGLPQTLVSGTRTRVLKKSLFNAAATKRYKFCSSEFPMKRGLFAIRIIIIPSPAACAFCQGTIPV